MIEAIAAVFQFGMFAIWKMDDKLNMIIKVCLLFGGLALAFEAMREFGYIVQLPDL